MRLGLEGIVSKKRAQPYVSGRNGGWVKCKTAVYGARRTAIAGRRLKNVGTDDGTNSRPF